MTKLQRLKYFRLWSAACRARGWDSSDRQERHNVHVTALGTDKPTNKLTNADIDKIYAVLLALGQPSNLTAQVDQLNQPRKRMLHAISRHAPEYRDQICRDRFGHTRLSDLKDPQLQQLAMTLDNRERSARKRRDLMPPGARWHLNSGRPNSGTGVPPVCTAGVSPASATPPSDKPLDLESELTTSDLSAIALATEDVPY